MNKKTVQKLMIIEIITIFTVIALDLLLKAYSEKNLIGTSVPLIEGIVNLTYVKNSGAAFGMLQNQMLFFKIITVIAFSVFFYFLYKKRGESLLLSFSLALIIGGTAGNFIDRVKLGFVRDMIELKFMDFAVFNIADSALTVGVILLSVYFLFIYKEPKKAIVDINATQNDKFVQNDNALQNYNTKQNDNTILNDNAFQSDNAIENDNSTVQSTAEKENSTKGN